MDLNAKSANTSSINVNESQERVVKPTSSSRAALSPTAASSHRRHPISVSAATDMCQCGKQTNASSTLLKTGIGKRKRCSSEEDLELDSNPPSAKRQQRLIGIFTSPGTVSTQEIHSERSFVEKQLAEIPHSPLPDSPDSPSSPDRGSSKQHPAVVRYVAKADQPQSRNLDKDDHVLDDSSEEYSFDEYDEVSENIDNSNASPTSSTGTGCSQICERTPATQHLQDSSNSCRHVNKLNSLDSVVTQSNYKCMSPVTETSDRQCPLPALSWANASDVWKVMCQRDEEDSFLRSSVMLEQHPGLQPRMRAILLDWLIEVCEVYKLHRETFYLAVDYLDRYLYGERQVQKTHLQLIGITCLFVAAKVEEIYPPKICEFAYVTDGACTERDILQHEQILLQALGWDICPITVIGWLGIYMQLNVSYRTPASLSQIGGNRTEAGTNNVDDAFIYPQFSAFEFVHTCQLLDMCTLDVGMANYPYSVLAAAAISHTFNRETALRCSGLDWETVQPCARWLEPFFNVISEKAPYIQLNEQNEQITNKFGLGHICPNIVTDDSHIIQTHSTTMDMYDELLMEQNASHAMRALAQASPATALRAPENLLTPPASSQKPDAFLADEEEVAAIASGKVLSNAHSPFPPKQLTTQTNADIMESRSSNNSKSEYNA